MITRARVFGRKGDVLVAGTLFVGVALLSASLLGAVLGGFGQLLGAPTREVVSILALLVTSWVALSRTHPWQLERETNVNWLLYRDWRTAAYNAISLAFGFTTRIGFWLFFLVPIGAFMAGEARLGALIYGAYAASRTCASLAQAIISFQSEQFIQTVQLSYRRARSFTDAFLFAGVGYLLVSVATS